MTPMGDPRLWFTKDLELKGERGKLVFPHDSMWKMQARVPGSSDIELREVMTHELKSLSSADLCRLFMSRSDAFVLLSRPEARDMIRSMARRRAHA